MLTYGLQFDTNASMEESLPMKSCMSTWAPILRTAVLLSTALILSTACSSGEPQKDFKQGQPPVVVVQAPGSTPAKDSKTDSSYAGLAWEAATSGAVGDSVEEVEPYDIVSLLREFEPAIIDPAKDQDGENGYDDLLSSLVVADSKNLYGRIVTRVPMRGFYTREVRFWIEQPPEMATVEIKVGTRGRPCEIAHVKSPDAQKVVKGCFWLGNALDFRLPLDAFPASMDITKPMWVSGFQTCCSDPERNKFLDEIDKAQEIWRITGEAAPPIE